MISLDTVVARMMELETKYYELQAKYQELIHEYEKLKEKRLWVGLTPADMAELSAEWGKPNENETALIDWAEIKLKEKNT